MFEKKMLILSGDGKGVTLIEKASHGVSFSVRTFDLTRRGDPLKIGIITPARVYVRDLPDVDNPAASFTLQDCDTTDMHVAVFDDKLRLYGATGKKMWESNVMGLLENHERRHRTPEPPPPLPPIAPPPPPAELPLPDGTGLPQSRIAVYGDDDIAENDFYTPLAAEIAARMPKVDGFLNSDRVINMDALAPRITPCEGQIEQTNPNEEEEQIAERNERTEPIFFVPSPKTEEHTEPEKESESNDEQERGQETEQQYMHEFNSNNDQPEQQSAPEPSDLPRAEAAATQQTVERTAPWQTAAAWIKKQSTRELVPRQPVAPPKPTQKIVKLRESSFFERTRADVEKLFESAPKDDELSRLLPDIEWVKVTFDGNTVCVGRSSDTFLCYAVFGEYSSSPPLGEKTQWLPCDKNLPTGSGYWLIFQNAHTGELLG